MESKVLTVQTSRTGIEFLHFKGNFHYNFETFLWNKLMTGHS